MIDDILLRLRLSKACLVSQIKSLVLLKKNRGIFEFFGLYYSSSSNVLRTMLTWYCATVKVQEFPHLKNWQPYFHISTPFPELSTRRKSGASLHCLRLPQVLCLDVSRRSLWTTVESALWSGVTREASSQYVDSGWFLPHGFVRHCILLGRRYYLPPIYTCLFVRNSSYKTIS